MFSSLRTIWIVIKDGVHISPVISYPLPVLERGEWSQNEEWASEFADLVEVIEQRQGHYRLSESHLVCQHHVSMLVPSSYQPIETCHLVLL